MIGYSLILFLISTHTTTTGYNINDEVIIISKSDQITNITSRVSFFVDTQNVLNISDIVKSENQKRFVPHTNDVYTDLANEYSTWFRIIIQNDTGSDLWMEAGANASWYLDFYRPDSTGVYSDSTNTGAFRPEANKEFPVNFYWLKVADRNNSDIRTYYLRFASGLNKELPLYVGTITSLIKKKEKNDYLTAGYIGILIVMVLYNLFLGISIRDRIYFYYIIYLITLGIAITFANHYPLMKNPIWLEYFFAWGSIFHFFSCLFSTTYLDLKKNAPNFNNLAWGLAILITVIIPVINLAGVPSHNITLYFQISVAALYFTLLFAGVHLLLKGHKNARFYVLGWSFANISIILFVFVLNGLIPYNLFTRNVIYFGTSIEVFMFSLALADRINILKREKEIIQGERLQLIEYQNQILEQKVLERTAEIHHRIKNTLQMISSLLSMQHRRIDNEAVQNVLVQTRNRVKSIGLIHEHLYKQEYLSNINLHDYVTELVEMLVQTLHKGSVVEIKYDIQPLELEIDRMIPTGLIINELVTNSIKYAFRNNKQPMLSVKIRSSESELILLISDNGKSLSKRTNKGFGQTIIQTLLDKEGSFDISKDENGYHVRINFRMKPF